MPRFSQKAKEILDVIWYYTDIEKAKQMQNGLEDPLDITFGKLFIATYYIHFQQFGEFLKILTELKSEGKRLQDPYIQFMINIYYCWHYMGLYNPIVNKDQAQKYFENSEQSYQNIDYKDNWEKYYCLGWYYLTKAEFEWKIKDDLSTAIKYHKKCIEVWSKVPEDGIYYSAIAHIDLGLGFIESGDFVEVEKSLNRVLEVSIKYNNLYQLWPLFALSHLHFIKGNLHKAKELNIQRLEVAKGLNSIFGTFMSLTLHGYYLYEEGKYEESIKSYQESLVYRKRDNDPLSPFWGYYSIFDFYYQRYKITRDKTFFVQAEQSLIDLQKFSKVHSDDKIIVNYTNYAHAQILKWGTVRKKANAIDILEELSKFYPHNIEISLNLLQLLFEDAIQSDDQETINQIDTLMQKINKAPLRNDPQAIFAYISQQTFLAKYNYYIKANPRLAMNILTDAKDRISTYKLDNLTRELDTEIQALEKELTRWNNLDRSVKDRIEASEFNKYIEEALKVFKLKMDNEYLKRETSSNQFDPSSGSKFSLISIIKEHTKQIYFAVLTIFLVGYLGT